MSAIFISYRRADAEGHAGRLFEALVKHFGEGSVFMDVATIEPGRDFRKIIDSNVADCDAVLTIIGNHWLDVKDERGQRRIEDPTDFVRLETISALQRDIPVIPVLVHNAEMPRADQLPTELQELAYRNSVELTHARWPSDVRVLIRALEHCLSDKTTIVTRNTPEPDSIELPLLPAVEPEPRQTPGQRRGLPTAIKATALLAVLALLIWSGLRFYQQKLEVAVRTEAAQQEETRKTEQAVKDKRLAEEARLAKEATEQARITREAAEQALVKKKVQLDAKAKAQEEENARLADLAAEQARLLAEQRRRIEDAELKRLINEAKRKRLADEQALAKKKARLLADQRRRIEEAERKRLLNEAKRKRLADEAEKERLAKENEEIRLALEMKRKFIFGTWTGDGKDISAGNFETRLELTKEASVLKLKFPFKDTGCEFKLDPKSSLEDFRFGSVIEFDAKRVAGFCLNFRLKLIWIEANQMEYRAYRVKIRYANAVVSRPN